jgi:hypothetical protein
LFVIRAAYTGDVSLYYAGPSNVTGASRSAVSQFTEQQDRATGFTRSLDAMHASWRALPPRKHNGASITRVQIVEPAA